MPVSEQAYLRRAMQDPDGQWELHRGAMRHKPATSFEHNDVMMDLGYRLRTQLDPERYRVRANAGRVRRSPQNYYIPDVFVIPIELTASQRGTHQLEAYTDPLPLVVEVWSPSTGNYDVEVKLQEYQRRGDLEIRRIHPYERTLTAWRRQPDGSYTETLYRDGRVPCASLPTVTIDLPALFT